MSHKGYALKKKRRGMASFLTNLLFPPRCVFCDRLMEERFLQICDECGKQLPEPPTARRGEFFQTCVSALPYEGMVRTSVLRMKMGAKQSYTTTFGRLLAKQIQEKLNGQYDVVTWVPISSMRRFRRGFDQDLLIAKAAAEELLLPVERLLRKRRHNRAQSSIHDVAKRRSNVLNAYRPAQKQPLYGKRVLLIDDVITTGATLSECSRVLLLAGAAQVVCATYAAANRKQ